MCGCHSNSISLQLHHPSEVLLRLSALFHNSRQRVQRVHHQDPGPVSPIGFAVCLPSGPSKVLADGSSVLTGPLVSSQDLFHINLKQVSSFSILFSFSVRPNVILGVTNPFFIKTFQTWPHIVRLGEIKMAGRKPYSLFTCLLFSRPSTYYFCLNVSITMRSDPISTLVLCDSRHLKHLLHA